MRAASRSVVEAGSDAPGSVEGLQDIEQRIVVRFDYPVRFTRRLLDPANPVLRDAVAGQDRARVLVAVDDGLARAHPALTHAVASYCRAHDDRLELAAPALVLPGGEGAKNQPTAVQAVRAAIDAHGIDRHAYVVAMGGGAMLDAVGYAAATVHRGVRLIRVPSTVLAQGDAAVGVKNGVNAFGKKNMIGTFAPPHAVLNDLDLLLTLSDRDWRAGISEAIKVALIRDAGFFAWLEREALNLRGRSLPAMAQMIHRSAELHLEHTATGGDPFERGSARPLDFGHWAAHKLEQLTDHDLRHGEAVGVGLALDCTYAHLLGALSEPHWRRAITLLEAVGLPVWHPGMEAGGDGRPELLAGLEEFREHLGGRLTITLLDHIGSGFEVHEVDGATMLRASAMMREWTTGGARAAWTPTPAPAR